MPGIKIISGSDGLRELEIIRKVMPTHGQPYVLRQRVTELRLKDPRRLQTSQLWSHTDLGVNPGCSA